MCGSPYIFNISNPADVAIIENIDYDPNSTGKEASIRIKEDFDWISVSL